MEQTTQQTIQKPPLPIKTKIAAWWVFGIGIIQLLVPFRQFSLYVIPTIFAGFLLIGLGFSILKRKKLGWFFTVSILSISLIYLFFFFFFPDLAILKFFIFLSLVTFPVLLFIPSSSILTFPPLILFLLDFILTFPPLILFLLDRKNFWKSAAYMEKVSLPIKTKIAAWWIKTIGIGIIFIGLGLFITLMFYAFWWIGPSSLLLPLSIFLLGGFICFLGSRIAKGRRWAWWMGILTLLIIWIFYFGYQFLYFRIFQPATHDLVDIFRISLSHGEFFLFILSHIFILPPILLLLLDRKNFWKIAS